MTLNVVTYSLRDGQLFVLMCFNCASIAINIDFRVKTLFIYILFMGGLCMFLFVDIMI